MAPPAKTPRRGYSTDETEEIYNALMFLANEFEEDNAPLQAVRCYEALCLKDLTLLPVPEARARVRLASLLLQYTDNVHRAKQHLETCMMLLKNVHGYEKLKCQTFSGLARCYRLFGRDVRMSWLNATTSGLDLARQAEKKYPDEREDWVTWQFHFMMDRADLYMVYCDFAAAERELAAGAALARETGMSEVAVAFALARLQRAIAQRGAGEGPGAGEMDAAKAVEDAVNALEEAVGEEAAAPARLHLHVLRTLGNLAAGNVHATAEVPKIVARLVKSIEGKTDDEIEEAHAYKWLPVRATIALAKLLTGESLRPLGKFSEARRDLEEAMDQCDAALKHLGVMPEGGDADAKAIVEQEQLIAEQRAAMEKEGSPSGRGGSKTSPRGKTKGKRSRGGKKADADEETEDQPPLPPKRQWVGSEIDLAPRTANDAKPYLHIRMLALQGLVGADLTATKLSLAAARTEQMRAMVESYPRTLRGYASVADHAEGQVLHSLGMHEEAAARFAAAAAAAESFGPDAMRDIAAVCGGLSELAEGSPGGISRALDLVRPVLKRHEAMQAAAVAGADEKTGEKDASALPNFAHQAAALFVSGYANIVKGDAAQEAKPKLSKALKLAHTQCCNHQLVAQSLSLIGTIVLDTRGGDLSQSLDMLQSSFTLSKAQEDMPAQLGCLDSLLRLHRIRGSDQEEQDALVSYHRRKASAYQSLVRAALEDEERLARITNGGIHLDDAEEMEVDEDET